MGKLTLIKIVFENWKQYSNKGNTSNSKDGTEKLEKSVVGRLMKFI